MTRHWTDFWRASSDAAHPHDADLNELLAGIGDELYAEPSRGADFAASVARAHALDPTRVDPARVEAARQIAMSTSVDEEALRRRPVAEHELREMIVAAKAALETAIDARRHQGIPAFPTKAPRSRSRWVATTVVAVAACALLGVGLVRSLEGLRLDAASEGTSHGAAQLARADEAHADLAQHRFAPPGAASNPNATSSATSSEAESAPLPSAAPAVPEEATSPTHTDEDTSVRPNESAREPRPIPTKPERRRKGAPVEDASAPTAIDPLVELDRAAQAAWKAGHLDEATRLFETILERGGRHRLVEMAYGDLFTLARQRAAGRDSALLNLWESYLRRFPRGRFAEDARVGLCTRATADRRKACFARYLADFPSGAYRSEAEAAMTP